MKLHLLVLLLAASLGFAGCETLDDVAEQVLDDEASALKDDDLPNCSRVINCCNALETGSISAAVPEAVSSACQNTVAVAADASIDEYQRQLAAIDAQTNVSEEDRATLRADLQEEWQNRIEPGCRCFMEDSVGTIPSIALPVDCEPFTTTGDLEGATCSEALESLTAAPTTN
ncbi:MAG: hypothetical protein KC561_04775 [Myxococcales bacterium]|nr:hypothetical protein [Myxococcales bacterium]